MHRLSLLFNDILLRNALVAPDTLMMPAIVDRRLT